MDNKIDIYKIIYSNNNNNLIQEISKAFDDNLELTGNQIQSLKIANKLATLSKLNDCHNLSELNAENLTGYDLIYIAVINNKIACKFCHSYYKVFNQIYLDQANTNPAQANKGLGTKVYMDILSDIKKVFKPSTICADAISPSGKRFLEKVGFFPNTHPDSKDTNAIYYLNERKPFLIDLNDLPTSRDMALAPNIEKFNSIVGFANSQSYFNREQAKEVFYQVYNARQKGYKVSDMLNRENPQNNFFEMFSLEDLIVPNKNIKKPSK